MERNNTVYKPNRESRLAVTSRSFSRNKTLRDAVLSIYPNTKFNDEGIFLKEKQLIEFLDGQDMAITALETINEGIIRELPELKIISKYGVGIDMIDLKALYIHKVYLGWQGGINKRSVSELVIALIINLLRNIPNANNDVSNNNWNQITGCQLTGRTVGIIDLGHIGKDLVKLLQPFRCKVIANDILSFPEFCDTHNVEQVDLKYLLRKSDVISIHVSLDNSTKLMIGETELSLMKTDALLINTARGNIVDEAALKSVLIEKKISGAAFDVFALEPPNDLEFLKIPNFIVTPHIGGSTIEAILAMGHAAISGLTNAMIVLPENFNQ